MFKYEWYKNYITRNDYFSFYIELDFGFTYSMINNILRKEYDKLLHNKKYYPFKKYIRLFFLFDFDLDVF